MIQNVGESHNGETKMNEQVTLNNGETWEKRGRHWHMVASTDETWQPGDYSPVQDEHFDSYAKCCNTDRFTSRIKLP